MRQNEWVGITPQVIRIAQAAGARIMAIYGGGQAQAHIKPDQSPVTEADLASHQCLVAGLTGLGLGCPVVSEEDAATLQHRRPDNCFWLLDPLDGTKEFLCRNGEFTVNIALVDGGRPVLGVVAAPALGCLYWAAQGQGAYRVSADGAQRIHVTSPQGASTTAVRVVASRSHLDTATQAFIDRLGCVSLVQVGSSLKFCMVAEGRADIYPRFGPTCEWDTAAAQVIVEEAGGLVVSLDGLPLRYGKAEVLNPFFIVACALEALPHD